jgi:5-methylcytosine-specific restriction endonuclease McrA
MGPSSSVDEKLAGCPAADTAGRPDVLAVLGGTLTPPRPPVHRQSPARPTGPVTKANVLRLLDWQQYRCALTGRVLTPETASLDHIVPVRSGGEHQIENTQVLHRDVNRAKTTMTCDEFVQLCREVVEHRTKQHAEGGRP